MRSFLEHFFTRTKSFIILIVLCIFVGMGYRQWRETFINTYYPSETSIQGQLFPNVEHTTVKVQEKIWPLSKVKYHKIIVRIGSLSSEYNDTKQADKANSILNSSALDKNFKEWLIKAFDKKEAKKISDHVEIYYRGVKIKEISY